MISFINSNLRKNWYSFTYSKTFLSSVGNLKQNYLMIYKIASSTDIRTKKFFKKYNNKNKPTVLNDYHGRMKSIKKFIR